MEKNWEQYSPFELSHNEKQKMLLNEMQHITDLHSENCKEYSKILASQRFDLNNVNSVSDFPFLPVRLFKLKQLKSVSDDEIVKTMTSSGTTGQQVSKIYLDKHTSILQTKILTKIITSYIGQKRLPMLILDSEEVLKNRNIFSARGAGILGFSMFGLKRLFAFDGDMNLKEDDIKQFLAEHDGQPLLLFGFTFIVYQYFLKTLESLSHNFDLSNAILIHGGGWKKLVNESISSVQLKTRFRAISGLQKIYDYYGMVEQTGSIYMECERGFLHAPVYSDVIIRRPSDFSIADINEPGLIQVISLIPRSYPGHSLLTEDEGLICGIDDCTCGRKGKYFKVLGRIKMAEIRGCSDTFESRN